VDVPVVVEPLVPVVPEVVDVPLVVVLFEPDEAPVEPVVELLPPS